MKVQSRCQSGLQSAGGLAVTGRSTPKVAHHKVELLLKGGLSPAV